MPVNTSRAAYSDCQQLFDKALAEAKGIRVPVATEGAGRQLVTRMNFFRKLDRKQSEAVWQDPANPNFGISAYDDLIVHMPKEADGRWWVYIDKRSRVIEVESLGDAAE